MYYILQYDRFRGTVYALRYKVDRDSLFFRYFIALLMKQAHEKSKILKEVEMMSKRNLAESILLLVILITFGGVRVADAAPLITDGLVAAYEFNGNANDDSGNGHNGIVNGATLTQDRFGNSNAAYSYYGMNYIDYGALNFSNELTVSAWAMFPSIEGTNAQAIVNKYDGYEGAGDSTIIRSFDLYRHDWSRGYRFYFCVSEDGASLDFHGARMVNA